MPIILAISKRPQTMSTVLYRFLPIHHGDELFNIFGKQSFLLFLIFQNSKTNVSILPI